MLYMYFYCVQLRYVYNRCLVFAHWIMTMMAVPLHGHGDGSSAAQMVGDVHVPRRGSVQRHYFRQKGTCDISVCSGQEDVFGEDAISCSYSDVAWMVASDTIALEKRGPITAVRFLETVSPEAPQCLLRAQPHLYLLWLAVTSCKRGRSRA